MTDRPVFAADRLERLEETLNEVIQWQRDVTADVALLADLVDHLRQFAADVVDILRPLTVPGTDSHLRLANALDRLRQANDAVIDRAVNPTFRDAEASHP